MLHNNKEAYLAYSLYLKMKESFLIDSFAIWLPDQIIDCHTHCNLPEHVDYMEEKTYKHMISTFPSFTMKESSSIKRLLFPNKTVRSLRFTQTFRGINHRKANQYLLENCDSKDRVALFGLPEDEEYTISMLSNSKVSALKMYYSYVEPTAIKIYEVFKPEILKEAQTLGIPIILHLPKIITRSKEDIKQVVRDFPNLKISIAHLGSSKILVPGIEDAFKELSKYANISLDTALNPSSKIVTLALQTFGENRVMFGSDEPLNLIRSKVFVHPQKGQRLITEYLYHWVDREDHNKYSHLAKGVIHSHWLSMNAIRSAVNTFSTSSRERIIEKIFHKNAEIFFKF
jgi:predicted TIM-barrel fold metal-dependent hydrolase